MEIVLWALLIGVITAWTLSDWFDEHRGGGE